MKTSIKLLLLFTVLSIMKMNAQKEEFFQSWKMEKAFFNGKDTTDKNKEIGSILTFNKDKSLLFEIYDEKIKGSFTFEEKTETVSMVAEVDSEPRVFKIISVISEELKIEIYLGFDKLGASYKSVKPQK